MTQNCSKSENYSINHKDRNYWIYYINIEESSIDNNQYKSNENNIISSDHEESEDDVIECETNNVSCSFFIFF